jgi:hypothetical protein
MQFQQRAQTLSEIRNSIGRTKRGPSTESYEANLKIRLKLVAYTFQIKNLRHRQKTANSQQGIEGL